MRSLMIFLGGAVTGAAVTYLAMKYVNQKEEPSEIDLDGWEEVDIESIGDNKERNEKKEETKEEDKQMPTPEEISIADAHNKAVHEYVEAHKEPPIEVTEPVLITEEEFYDCPYNHNSYQYFAMDNLLIDDQLHIVDTDICGTEYVDICESDGVAYVRNDEEEQCYEIEYYDEESYEEVKAKYLDEDPFSYEEDSYED